MGASLASANLTNLDISTEVEVLRYVYDGTVPFVAHARLDITWLTPLVADTNFTARIFVNDNEILPEFQITAPSGRSGFVSISHTNVLTANDIVSLVVGCPTLGEDVGCKAVLMIDIPDMTNLIADITNSLKGLNVHPERILLGPCKRKVKTFKLPIDC